MRQTAGVLDAFISAGVQNVLDCPALMLDSGTTVSAAAKWLGHDPAMTLRVYGHVYEDALASAGDVLLGGMSRANGER